MAFKSNFETAFTDCDIFDEEPFDLQELINPYSNLECEIFFDPARFDPFKSDLLKGLALQGREARYRIFVFIPVDLENLSLHPEFTSSRIERDFTTNGFVVGAGNWGDVQFGEVRLERRPPDHLIVSRNLKSLRYFAFQTKCTLEAIQDLMPKSRWPEWLRPIIEDIMTPVCGRRSTARGEDAEHQLHLIMDGSLLLGSENIDSRHAIVPSISMTLNTASMVGRSVRYTEVQVRSFIKKDLQAYLADGGQISDLPFFAVQLCQKLMRLRAIAELVRRQFCYAQLSHGGKEEAERAENDKIHASLRKRLKKQGKGYKRRKIIALEASPRDRIMLAFHGGVGPTSNSLLEYEIADLEVLARWLGFLQREGTGILTAQISLIIYNIFNENSPDFNDFKETRDFAECCAEFDSMLPEKSWLTLRDAASLPNEGNETIKIQYSFFTNQNCDNTPRIDQESRIVHISGPFLLTPLVEIAKAKSQMAKMRHAGFYE